MNLLLDTHTILWAFGKPERLGERAREAIVDPRNDVAVSAVTVWEVEIKRALGKLRAPDGFAALCDERGFEQLAVTFAHAERAGRLPRHHDDPFDRMLIAQAQEDGFEVITADRAFEAYHVGILSALG